MEAGERGVEGLLLSMDIRCGSIWLFQWNCWFHTGCWCFNYARQIRWWMGVVGRGYRFCSLYNRIIAMKAMTNNASISSMIHQTLLHWGLQITKDVLKKHKRR
jgi:hypothetical protein